MKTIQEKVNIIKTIQKNILSIKKDGEYINDVHFSDELLSVELYVRLITLLENRLVTIEELIHYINMTEAVANRELKMLENISEASVVILDETDINSRLKDVSKIYSKTFLERTEEKIDAGISFSKDKIQDYKPHLEKGIEFLEKGTEKTFSFIKKKLK